MPRYIDVDKVVKWSYSEPRYSDSVNDRTDLRDFLLSLPTLSPDDARGVGEWEQKEVFSLDDTTIEQMQSARCSVCGKYHTTPFSYYFTEYNYCPSCGAAMQNTKKKQHTMDEFMYGQEGNPADGSL